MSWERYKLDPTIPHPTAAAPLWGHWWRQNRADKATARSDSAKFVESLFSGVILGSDAGLSAAVTVEKACRRTAFLGGTVGFPLDQLSESRISQSGDFSAWIVTKQAKIGLASIW